MDVLFQLQTCVGDVRVDEVEVIELCGDAAPLVIVVLNACGAVRGTEGQRVSLPMPLLTARGLILVNSAVPVYHQLP